MLAFKCGRLPPGNYGSGGARHKVGYERETTKLFGGAAALPEGFGYDPDILRRSRKRELLERVRGFRSGSSSFKAMWASGGWFPLAGSTTSTTSTPRGRDIPPFCSRCGRQPPGFADMSPSQLQQVLVTEYDAGAGIGWHRDKAMFGEVIGISLLSACRFRLRRRIGTTWERAAIIAEPRSAYLLSGPSRTEWEHSIPEVDTLRYSITFRNFRSAA